MIKQTEETSGCSALDGPERRDVSKGVDSAKHVRHLAPALLADRESYFRVNLTTHYVKVGLLTFTQRLTIVYTLILHCNIAQTKFRLCTTLNEGFVLVPS